MVAAVPALCPYRVMLNEVKHLGSMADAVSMNEILRLRLQNDTLRATPRAYWAATGAANSIVFVQSVKSAEGSTLIVPVAPR